MNSKPVVVQVPQVEMWNETCPQALTEVRGWFKDSPLEEMGPNTGRSVVILLRFVTENLPLKITLPIIPSPDLLFLPTLI